MTSLNDVRSLPHVVTAVRGELRCFAGAFEGLSPGISSRGYCGTLQIDGKLAGLGGLAFVRSEVDAFLAQR